MAFTEEQKIKTLKIIRRRAIAGRDMHIPTKEPDIVWEVLNEIIILSNILLKQ